MSDPIVIVYGMTGLLIVRMLHFTGFAVWLAGLAAMALLLQAGARNKAAGILADVGATLTIITGIYNAITRSLFSMGWLHLKLAFVVALIVVHVLLRRRTRKGVTGGAAGFLGATIALAVAIIFSVVFQPFRP